MARKGGSKEGISRDSSLSVPGEQKMASESNKLKISRIHEMYSTVISKENVSKILQYYDDDEHEAIDAITRDGGCEALTNWTDSVNSKSKNNKNKKKKKKGKKEPSLGSSATASFDADDSSSGNVDAEVEKEGLLTENSNGVQDPDPVDEDEQVNATLEVPTISSNSVEQVPQTNTTVSEVSKGSSRELDNPVCASPASDSSDKREDSTSKRDKFRSVRDEGRYSSRQRTNSFRRSKTSSLSEDSSNQHNPQAIAAPTKRGFEKCKKDLNKQTIYLQRIQTQLERGLEESSKKLKNVFSDIKKMLDQRQEQLELKLAKSKEESLNLLKSRQDLAVDLKRRVDRTPSLTEAEWTDLRSDVKQFVTERKYDDELGKTIWFQWSITEISEQVQNFGEVCPVKNVYSQRSHSALSNVTACHNNPEPSPSSSLANEDISSNTDKNDVADILDTEEETPAVKKDTAHPVQRNQPAENRPRIFSNTKYHSNRGRGFNRGNKGYPRFPRNNNQNSYRNSGYSQYDYSDYRNNVYQHQDRDGRMHSNNSYSNDRNMNPHRNNRNDKRGQSMNYRPNMGGRNRGNMGHHHSDNATKTEPVLHENSDSVNCEKANVVNGFENN